MPTSRRELLKLASWSAASLAAPRLGAAPAAERPLRILILGGTGFTGPHQVRYALSRGHRITLFNRGRRPKEWPAPVEELVGDRNDPASLRVLEGREWDVCIDNPTSLPFWVRDVGRVLKGKVKQYVFISTLSVYASDQAVDQDESAPLARYAGPDAMKETMETLRADVAGLYGPLKALCEKEAETHFGGQTTVIRPGLIVGPGDETDRFTYWPVRLGRGGRVLAPGDGSDPVHFVDARDLAEWTIRMVEARSFGVYNAMGPAEPTGMKGLLEGIRAAIGSQATLCWAPSAFLEAQKVSAWADMPVWIPAQGETAGANRRQNRKAIAAGLGFRPLATTARDTLAWFETLPAERQQKLRAGIEPEREQAVLAALEAQARKG